MNIEEIKPMKSIIMDLYLKQLYNFEYDPFIKLSKDSEIYSQKLDTLNSLKDSFYKNLTKNAQKQYDDIFNLQYELEDLTSAYSFSEGFKLAYQISSEAFYQYQNKYYIIYQASK